MTFYNFETCLILGLMLITALFIVIKSAVFRSKKMRKELTSELMEYKALVKHNEEAYKDNYDHMSVLLRERELSDDNKSEINRNLAADLKRAKDDYNQMSELLRKKTEANEKLKSRPRLKWHTMDNLPPYNEVVMLSIMIGVKLHVVIGQRTHTDSDGEKFSILRYFNSNTIKNLKLSGRDDIISNTLRYEIFGWAEMPNPMEV